jgi:glycosyltransferase involved in cell wall biosynthesis
VATDFLYPARPANVVVATNGVDLEQFPFIGPGRDRRIVFIGNITSEQNFDACVFFARHVLPHLAEFQFHVIGRVPRNKAAALASYPRVMVAGEVPSISHVAAGAFASVCPVRIGAGVQNKVLEYLAMGIPAVSTSIGIEGLALVPERDVLRADNPAEIAHALARLWNEPALADRLAISGHNYVAESHSWDRTLSPLVDSVMNAIEQRTFVSAAGR